jgi:hypothetical protein
MAALLLEPVQTLLSRVGVREADADRVLGCVEQAKVHQILRDRRIRGDGVHQVQTVCEVSSVSRRSRSPDPIKNLLSSLGQRLLEARLDTLKH